MITHRLHNPHLQIMLLGLFLLFYNYYEDAISISSYTYTHNIMNRDALYIIYALSPFTFSSLVRPIGGIMAGWWQRNAKHCILPALLMLYSILGLFAIMISKFVYLDSIASILLVIRIFQGLLLGGIVPLYLMYFYDKSSNLGQNIFYSTNIFITIYVGILISNLIIHFIPNSVSYYLNIGVNLCFVFIAFTIFRFKHLWGELLVENIPVTQSLSLWNTIKFNYSSIIRFAMFLSFMTSIDSFFLTIMPFYLVHYLHYQPSEVFPVVIATTITGIIGFIIGGYYHNNIGKKWHLTLGIIIKIILYLLFRVYVHHNLQLIEIFGCSCMFCAGLMLAKVSLILNSIFPPNARLHSIIITYNVSRGLMFGFFGFIIMFLLNHFHNLYMPSLFILFFSYVSLISLWFTPEQDFYRYLSKKS